MPAMGSYYHDPAFFIWQILPQLEKKVPCKSKEEICKGFPDMSVPYVYVTATCSLNILLYYYCHFTI